MYFKGAFSREIIGTHNGRAKYKVCSRNWRAFLNEVPTQSANVLKLTNRRKLLLVLIVVLVLFTACAGPPPRPKDSDPIPATSAIGCNTDDIGDSSDTARF